MSKLALLSFAAIVLLAIDVRTQTEDVRAATGLPIPIGAQVIYGKVTVKGLSADERPPTVFVSLLISGSQVDRIQTNDRGWYYFLRAPANGMSLVVEANNNEVGRMVLSGGSESSVRQDLEIAWNQGTAAQPPAVLSAKNLYPRSDAANKLFDAALAASKAKDNKRAIETFKQILASDPKDYVAATELGTVYFSSQKNDDAEAAYKQALTQKADFVPALMNLGKLYLVEQKYNDAATAFYGAVKADSTSADAFQYLGEAYLQLKQGSKAVIALNEALRLEPDKKAEIHLRLATLYTAAGAKDRAANEYKLYLEKRPDSPDKAKLEKFIRENSKP